MSRCCFRPKPYTLLNCRPLDVKSVNGFAVSCSAALFILPCVTEPQHTTLCVFRHFTHTHNFLFYGTLVLYVLLAVRRYLHPYIGVTDMDLNN